MPEVFSSRAIAQNLATAALQLESVMGALPFTEKPSLHIRAAFAYLRRLLLTERVASSTVKAWIMLVDLDAQSVWITDDQGSAERLISNFISDRNATGG